MAYRLDGKTAVVTGASKGLGAAIALRFAAEGAAVVVNYSHSRQAADDVVCHITRCGGAAVAIQADMRDEEQVRRLFAEAHHTYGGIDVLVNNAGVYHFQPLQDLTLETFRHHFDLNVYGYLLAIKEAIAYMSPGASIVNMSSTVTAFGPTDSSVYTATKGAIDGLTRALSNELAPRGIRVNAIKPGVVDTDGVQAGGFLTDGFGQAIVAETPLGRLGAPEDIAPAAVYLASDETAWMTGEYITLSGGHR
ncbi:3-oxoacyl-[acyl-carrier protein] reductase [Mycolicibacterium rutilum]|uniref:3-oxoacyl-[acyl-carrier protein] reductase n=1 Tax=Mycolicibacterium rutilum TaxID=370526 RepID=A0A1H6IY90_MYCRU|nr:glucose 1-dehydrogenase [Mycolicibacterium rutilum]OMC16606.1 short-chain dehydrogenase [Mycolicibacter heraklionensis]SEH54410.1 3-oxoacyl-[acyl-carrier protein] reductase [Mycolicibacterium rutilum]